MFDYFLTLMVFLPALTAVILLFFKSRNKIINISIFSSIVTFIMSAYLFITYDKNLGGIQFVDHFKWISSINIKSSYILGIDGLSAPLVLQESEVLKVTAATANRLHVVLSALEIKPREVTS